MPFDVFDPRPEPTNDGELLRLAQQMIADERFWIKLAWSSQTSFGTTQYCPVAAIALACNNTNFRQPTKLERRLCRLLVRQMPLRGGLWRLLVTSRLRVRIYNDHARTTHADIMRLFDAAIRSAGSVKSNASQWRLERGFGT